MSSDSRGRPPPRFSALAWSQALARKFCSEASKNAHSGRAWGGALEYLLLDEPGEEVLCHVLGMHRGRLPSYERRRKADTNSAGKDRRARCARRNRPPDRREGRCSSAWSRNRWDSWAQSLGHGEHRVAGADVARRVADAQQTTWVPGLSTSVLKRNVPSCCRTGRRRERRSSTSCR